MKKRLNPLNDYIFKRIMTDKVNLLAFLNAVLSLEDRKKLVSLEIIDNKELTKEMLTDKTGRLDVRAKTADGTQIEIEVQLTNQQNMKKRTLFYWAKLYLGGIKQGDNYLQLAKVITINILDFECLKNNRFHSIYQLWENGEARDQLTDLMELHFIEMPKFKRFNTKNYIDNPLHRCLKFLDRTTSKTEIKELVTMDQAIKRTEEKLEYLSSDEETLALYQAREDSLHERANMIYSAKAEGKAEGKLETARKMLAKGLSEELITEVTGLSRNEIAKITQDL